MIDKDKRDLIICTVKDTIGYAETKDRSAFLDGASVAIYKTHEVYEASIKNLNNLLTMYKNLYEESNSELITLAKIINKYNNIP
jgi:hypothetical protein